MSDKFDVYRSKLNEYETSLEQAKSLSGLMEKAANAENFAIVTKGGQSHFVVLSESQAIAVNGESITLDAIPGIKEAMKAMANKALAAALVIHQEKLEQLEQLSSTGNAPTRGVSASAASLPKIPSQS